MKCNYVAFVKKKMNNNFEFARHVSIDHRSSSVAIVLYIANVNSQNYNLNLR